MNLSQSFSASPSVSTEFTRTLLARHDRNRFRSFLRPYRLCIILMNVALSFFANFGLTSRYNSRRNVHIDRGESHARTSVPYPGCSSDRPNDDYSCDTIGIRLSAVSFQTTRFIITSTRHFTSLIVCCLFFSATQITRSRPSPT